MSKTRWALLIVIGAVAVLVALGWGLGWGQAVTLEGLRAHEQQLQAVHARHPLASAALYLVGYITLAALALPGAAIMTLAGGALFGLPAGVVLASFGSSIGATLAMLASRFLFRDVVRRRFRGRVEEIDRGLAQRGWIYLLSLRLVPAIPFFVVDVLFGLTDFPVRRFYVVSQVAMLPATVAYVNAGTQLGQVRSVSGILSPMLLASLVLLACLPLLARLVLRGAVRR